MSLAIIEADIRCDRDGNYYIKFVVNDRDPAAVSQMNAILAQSMTYVLRRSGGYYRNYDGCPSVTFFELQPTKKKRAPASDSWWSRVLNRFVR